MNGMDWLMTEPHPTRPRYGADDGRVGWRWHAVPVEPTHRAQSVVDRRPALCGVRPAHGWGGDLFANEMCERCRLAAVKRGVELPNWLIRSPLAALKEQRKQP